MGAVSKAPHSVHCMSKKYVANSKLSKKIRKNDKNLIRIEGKTIKIKPINSIFKENKIPAIFIAIKINSKIV